MHLSVASFFSLVLQVKWSSSVGWYVGQRLGCVGRLADFLATFFSRYVRAAASHIHLLLCLLPFPRVHDGETRRECSDRYSKAEGGRRRRWRKRSESLGTGDGCKEEEETEEDGGEGEGCVGGAGGGGEGGAGSGSPLVCSQPRVTAVSSQSVAWRGGGRLSRNCLPSPRSASADSATRSFRLI